MTATMAMQCTVYAPEKLEFVPLAVATQNGVQADARLTWSDGRHAVYRDREDRPHVVLLDPPALAKLAKVAAVLVLLCSPATAADVVSEDSEWIVRGQGVAVAADTVATAAHVLRETTTVDGQPATVIHTDGDIAYLSVQGVNGQTGPKPALGESVTIHARGRVVRGTMLTQNVYVSEPIVNGDSGSAVMHNGRCVGIVTGRVGDRAAVVEWINGQ